MTDAWMKNLGDKISAAEKVDRNRGRMLLEFESKEQKLNGDIREVNMREAEVNKKEVEVDRHRVELMRKLEKLSLESIALQVEREELDRKRDVLAIQKDKVMTDKGMLKDVKEKEGKRVQKLIRQKNDLEDAVKNRRQAADRQAEQEAREMKMFLRETIKRKIFSLECPVCMELAEAPIYCCSEQHLICKYCKDLDRCPLCREMYGHQGARRHRGAEEVLEDIKELRGKLGL